MWVAGKRMHEAVFLIILVRFIFPLPSEPSYHQCLFVAAHTHCLLNILALVFSCRHQCSGFAHSWQVTHLIWPYLCRRQPLLTLQLCFPLLLYPAEKFPRPPGPPVLSGLWCNWTVHYYCELTTAVLVLGCTSCIGAHLLHIVHCT